MPREFFAYPKDSIVMGNSESKMYACLDTKQKWVCKVSRETREIRCRFEFLSVYITPEEFEKIFQEVKTDE